MTVLCIILKLHLAVKFIYTSIKYDQSRYRVRVLISIILATIVVYNKIGFCVNKSCLAPTSPGLSTLRVVSLICRANI